MSNLKNYIEDHLKMLDRMLIATPENRKDLEEFANSNKGNSDLLLMQMAINFGYKLALKNVQEQLEK